MELIKLFFGVANESLKKFPDYNQKIEKEFYEIYEQLIYHTNRKHDERNDDYIDDLYDKLHIFGKKLKSEIRKKDI